MAWGVKGGVRFQEDPNMPAIFGLNLVTGRGRPRTEWCCCVGGS